MPSSVSLETLATGVELNPAGAALNGRAVFVYQRGTKIQQPVFSDFNLTSAMTQPLITGSDGTPGGIPGFIAAEVPVDFYDALAQVTTQADPISAADVAALQVAVQSTTTGVVTSNTIEGVGNMGSAYALDLSPALYTSMGVGVLNADCLVTLTGAQDGTTADLLLTQDATGSHALSFLVGTTTISTAGLIPTAANAAMVVSLYSPDSQTMFATAVPASLAVTQAPLAQWVGTIAPLVAGQLDPTVWPYQSVAAGHMTVVADPLGVKGNVIALAITETG